MKLRFLLCAFLCVLSTQSASAQGTCPGILEQGFTLEIETRTRWFSVECSRAEELTRRVEAARQDLAAKLKTAEGSSSLVAAKENYREALSAAQHRSVDMFERAISIFFAASQLANKPAKRKALTRWKDRALAAIKSPEEDTMLLSRVYARIGDLKSEENGAAVLLAPLRKP